MPWTFSVSVTTSVFTQHVFIEYPLCVRCMKQCNDENDCIHSSCPREVYSLAEDTASKQIITQMLF